MALSAPAQLSPAGPEPITATFWAFSSLGGWGFRSWAIAQSATYRSSRPMPTGSPLMPRTHSFSHWFS